jgi:L-fuconolactonase
MISHTIDRRRFLGLAGAFALTPFAARGEEAGMPDFPIVDSHFHVWDPQRLRYTWLDGNDLLNTAHGMDRFEEAWGPVKVAKAVFVQAECLPGEAEAEAEWVSELAKEHPVIGGIVPFAPLEQGEAVAPMLERYAAMPLVKGIRRLIQSEPEPGFCVRPGFVEGVRLLARHDLVFDLGVTRNQLPDATELARRCPDVRFILNHTGFPDIKGGVLDPWREDLRSLAELPNTGCKLSGMATAADREQWTLADLRPYIDHVLACFGPSRVAFGSDWPVALLATEYPRWVETAWRALGSLTPDERRAVFHDTAVSVYRLTT